MASSRIEAVMEHLTYTKGVVGVVLCNLEGVPISDSFQNLDRTVALQYTEMASALARQAAFLFHPVEEDSTERAKRTSQKSQRLLIEMEELNDDSMRIDDEEEDRGIRGGVPNSPVADAKNPLASLFNDILDGIRIRTRTNEVIIQCSEDFLVVVVQEV